MLKVWDLDTGELVASFPGDSVPRCCVFTIRRTIVFGDAAGRVNFLSLEFPKPSC